MEAASNSSWEQLGAVPTAELIQARLTLHWAAQVPAAFGAALVSEQADFGHVALDWNGGLGALVTGAAEGAGGSRAGLRLRDLTLLHLNPSQQVVDELPLHGKTLDNAMSWLTTSLREHLGSQLPRPLERPSHELPAHDAAEGGPLRLVPIAAFEELGRWFGNAARLLQSVRIGLDNSARVRCWPHHFDIASLVTLDPNKSAEEARSFGIGLSPGDAAYPEPYWYVTPWPYPPSDSLPALDGGGGWHTEGWTGATLPGSEIDRKASADAQLEQVRAFLRSGIAASQRLLS